MTDRLTEGDLTLSEAMHAMNKAAAAIERDGTKRVRLEVSADGNRLESVNVDHTALNEALTAACPICGRPVGFYRLRLGPSAGSAFYAGHGACRGSHAPVEALNRTTAERKMDSASPRKDAER